MKKNPYYRLKYIAGVPYLLTFGQGNADFKHDLCLNDTSVFLWGQLESAADAEELIAICADYFQCSQEQDSSMEISVKDFVRTLYSKGILLPEKDIANGVSAYKTFEIAGLFIRIYGPATIFSKELLSFESFKDFPDNSPHLQIYVQAFRPSHTKNGTLLLRNESLSIAENAEEYLLFFPAFKNIFEAHINKNGRTATIFCTPEMTQMTTEEISYVIRILFLYFAQWHHMLAIHSSSILYREKIWLFSAPSGTGKSTHSQLWHDLLGTPIVNGDLNLIAPENHSPVVHGIPWCGTSGIYDCQSYPLGGVIFLKQGPENHVSDLSDDLKQLYLLHRCISPTWTEAMQERTMNMIESFYDKILTCHFTCNTNQDAVFCIKQTIDTYLDNNLQSC